MTRDDVLAELSAIHDRTVANDNDASAQYRAEIDQRREAIISEGLSYDELVSRLAEYDVQTAFIADRWRAEICAREQTQLLVHEIVGFRRDRSARGGRGLAGLPCRPGGRRTSECKSEALDRWLAGEFASKNDCAKALAPELGCSFRTVRDWLKRA